METSKAMNEHERDIANWTLDLRRAELKLRVAKEKMESGLRTARAVLDKAEAEFHAECDRLKADVEDAQIEVERNRNDLEWKRNTPFGG